MPNGRPNIELMSEEVFASVVFVDDPPRILQPVPEDLTESTQFAQLWVHLLYFDRHNVGVLVPKRLVPHLKDVECWNELGFFDMLKKNPEEPIVQCLLRMAVEIPDFDIAYESFRIMCMVAHEFDALMNRQDQVERHLDTLEDNLHLAQANAEDEEEHLYASSDNNTGKRKRTK